MKNRTLLLLALSIILSSCATTNRYASSSFEDAIYQKPDSDNYLVVNTNVEKELEVLRGKTKESNKIMIDGKVVEAVYADEQGNVEIDANSETTYVILNPGESFEERLSKFDNPTYTININYVDQGVYNPWYGYMPYSAYRNLYWRHRWYSMWDPYMWSPWSNFGHHYWYTPYYSWYTPFYSHYPGSWGWPHYSYYHGPNYWYGGWGGYPYYGITGGGVVYSNRDRYYGRRESPRDNNATNRGAISGGSYNRRDVRTSQIRGASIGNNSNEITNRYSESIYRRAGRDNGVEMTRNEVNRNQSTTSNRSTNYQRRSNSSVNRTGTSSVNRSSTGARSSSSTVRRSTTTLPTRSSQYRRATTTTRSNNNSSTTRSSSYQGTSRTTSTRSTYSPPTRSTTRSNTSSSSSSSGSSGRSSTSSSSRSSSGSGYRR